MDLRTTSQSEDKDQPVSAYDEECSRLAANWLDKIFKILLPGRVYKRAHLGSYDKFVRNWLLDNQIAIAQEEGVIAVMRERKVYAVWKPPVEPKPYAPTRTQPARQRTRRSKTGSRAKRKTALPPDTTPPENDI